MKRLVIPIFMLMFFVFSGLSLAETFPGINDITVSNPMPNSVDLSWTAPGGGDFANSDYDVRYSTSPITENNWDSAIMTVGEPTVAASGTQSMTVTFLEPDTIYYFAIRTRNYVPFGEGVGMSVSGLSNIASATTAPRQGKVYYVSKSEGNDSYTGLYDSYRGGTDGPWNTILKAAHTMTAGDIVYVRAGIYTEAGNYVNIHPIQGGIDPTNSGTAGNNIVFKAYPNETPIIDPQQQHSAFFNNQKDYIIYDGLHVQNAQRSGFNSYSCEYIMIKNCVIKDTWTPGYDQLVTGISAFGVKPIQSGFYHIYRNNTIWEAGMMV